MEDQEKEFQAAYGEAMFYSHLIEDLLILHLYECSYYHVNGYKGLKRKTIRKMTHENRIDELQKIYPKENDECSADRLISALHIIRKIRNHVAHAFVPQVGCDFRTEEGIDQILAMLERVSIRARFWLKVLQETHEKVLNGAVAENLEAVLEREDPPFDARVSRSKIQRLLGDLERL